MRKLLALFSVFALALSMAISASASSLYWDYNGHEFPELPLNDAKPYRYIWLQGETAYLVYADGPLKTDNDGDDVESALGERVYSDWYIEQNGAWVAKFVNDMLPNGGSWRINSFIWANTDVYKKDGSLLISASEPVDPNAPSVCDGTSCPASDMNLDGICDDCGLALAFSVIRDGWPSVISIWDKVNYPYGVFQHNVDDSYSLYFLNEKPYTSNGTSLRVDKADFQVYDLVDDLWVYDRTGSGSIAFQRLDSGKILWVSDDIYYEGSVVKPTEPDFFPIPLWAVMELVTQGEMGRMFPIVVGMMRTLVVCGVGCLALLAVLKLFGKRSLIFPR